MALAMPAASYASYCGVLIWTGNHHTVVQGQLYRSAQLSGPELDREITADHIRTVLNLRGPNPSKDWYRAELAMTRARGVEHVDIGISARSEVPEESVAKILAVLRDAPKPILVHCASGADRTGFVAALYRYAIRGESAAVSDRELFTALWALSLPSEQDRRDGRQRTSILRDPRSGRYRS
ncbi:tyrosine-protein phosphatase [Lichenihabitans sp. PAMC28606]|uniref:tyrosine-protein phosphatase n=1 Tax=Lichenihabitans sp. PAMC28606 TaxID=2880932 RepID=UPI001D0AEF0E|nr:tyrosine-protein phosphatase [Lichenihabitans sp. PAMC28606]UDL94064.1 tyrosine-protein phosphatase [Lichenihabitans sp. PAMC28606]